jgi:hypothetical protein
VLFRNSDATCLGGEQEAIASAVTIPRRPVFAWQRELEHRPSIGDRQDASADGALLPKVFVNRLLAGVFHRTVIDEN